MSSSINRFWEANENAKGVSQNLSDMSSLFLASFRHIMAHISRIIDLLEKERFVSSFDFASEKTVLFQIVIFFSLLNYLPPVFPRPVWILILCSPSSVPLPGLEYYFTGISPLITVWHIGFQGYWNLVSQGNHLYFLTLPLIHKINITGKITGKFWAEKDV